MNLFFPRKLTNWSLATLLLASPLTRAADAPAHPWPGEPLVAGDLPIPEPISIWPDEPPQGAKNPTPEVFSPSGSIHNISHPTISVYLPPKGKSTGLALIFCPGGGYGSMDWRNHVINAARYFVPRGITVIGLKYRTRPPFEGTNDELRAMTLLDVQRAVRLVRSRASEWNIQKLGVVGYSAGANLTMNLAGHFDAGNSSSPDPVERESSRPDFIVSIATWHWREKISPFTFVKETPPVFFVHATNDGITGGAPIELPYAAKKQLEAIGVPVKMAVFTEGAHGVGNLIPQRVAHNFSATKWPEMLLAWLQELGVIPAKMNPAIPSPSPAPAS